MGKDSLSPAGLEGMERENKVYSLCEIVGIKAAGGGTCIFNSLSAVRQYRKPHNMTHSGKFGLGDQAGGPSREAVPLRLASAS